MARPTRSHGDGCVRPKAIEVVPHSLDICEGLATAAEVPVEQNRKQVWGVLISPCPDPKVHHGVGRGKLMLACHHTSHFFPSIPQEVIKHMTYRCYEASRAL